MAILPNFKRYKKYNLQSFLKSKTETEAAEPVDKVDTKETDTDKETVIDKEEQDNPKTTIEEGSSISIEDMEEKEQEISAIDTVVRSKADANRTNVGSIKVDIGKC